MAVFSAGELGGVTSSMRSSTAGSSMSGLARAGDEREHSRAHNANDRWVRLMDRASKASEPSERWARSARFLGRPPVLRVARW